MLTQEKVLAAIMAGRSSDALDCRDYARLSAFFPDSDLPTLGFTLKEGAAPREIIVWTEENVRKQLADDLAFGFEKTLNQRGISASLMVNVVQMWMWVLGDDELATSENYAQYGLPILKAVALKFGLPNPIGDDRGNESKYASGG